MSARLGWLFGAAALLGCLALPGTAHAVTTDGDLIDIETDVRNYPEVSAVVTLSAAAAGVGYPPEAFTVLEGNQPVSVTVDRIPTEDLEIALVMDTSGSMQGGTLDAAKSAAIEFVGLLPAEVKVAVIGFGAEPYLVSAPTTDRAAVTNGLAALTAGGETALYDAMIFTLLAPTPNANRALVVLSDGGDTSSFTSLEEAVGVVGAVKMNVIELATNDSNHDALDRLAGAGGGVVQSVADPAALGGLYADVASTLVNRYELRYRSSASGSVPLKIAVDTAAGLLEAQTTLELPAIEVAPTTPATAVSDKTADAAAETIPAVVPVAQTRTLAAPNDPPNRWLIFGAAAFFVALVVVSLLAGPLFDRRQGLINARLGLGRKIADAPSPSQVTQKMTGAAERFLVRRGRRSSLATGLESAGISLRPGEYMVLALVATLIVALVLASFSGVAGLLVGLAVTPFVASAVVRFKSTRRRASFNEQLPDSLQLLASTLRSGFGLSQALDAVANEAVDPVRSEFRRVLLETRVGRDMNESLRALEVRMASTDFKWVASAIDINREVGGDLAVVLDNVGETIRDRQRMVRQIRSLSAEGRISAYVLISLPIILGFALSAINPDYIEPLKSGTGLALVIVGCGMLVVGWIWMRRVIRIEY